MGFMRPNGLVSQHLLFNKCARHGVPHPGNSSPAKPLRVPADDVHGSHGRQVCRRHELYVSFQDLGWLVSSDSPFQNDCPHLCPRGGRPTENFVFIFLCFPSSLKGEGKRAVL